MVPISYWNSLYIDRAALRWGCRRARVGQGCAKSSRVQCGTVSMAGERAGQCESVPRHAEWCRRAGRKVRENGGCPSQWKPRGMGGVW